MRYSFVLVLALFPSVALAQTPDTAARKKQTLKWIVDLQAPSGGFYMSHAEPGSDAKRLPGLRATSAAVRSIKYLGGEIPNVDKHAMFVFSCYDSKIGGFAEPGGKPDVTVTSIGVMAAVELKIPKGKYAKVMEYLHENAKTFEEVRIGAAAVEAWGVKDCPFKLQPWEEIASQHLTQDRTEWQDGGAREAASAIALILRLWDPSSGRSAVGFHLPKTLADGQRPDGGWSKPGEKSSDIESTYRVMRALMLMEAKPKDIRAVRKFVASHRNDDGGYAVKPGDKSSMGGVYYAAVITKWLDEMEKPY